MQLDDSINEVTQSIKKLIAEGNLDKANKMLDTLKTLVEHKECKRKHKKGETDE